jgi:hypothetical protein
MLGLSGVIACSTPRPIRFRALVHLFSRTSFPGLVPDSRSGSLLRAYEDIERSSRSDSDLHTLQFGIVPVQGICSDDTDCRRPGHDLGQVLLPVTILVGCRTDEIVPSGPPGPGPRVPRASPRGAFVASSATGAIVSARPAPTRCARFRTRSAACARVRKWLGAI